MRFVKFAFVVLIALKCTWGGFVTTILWAGEAETNQSILELKTEFVRAYPEMRRRDLLARELFRQAVLLSAREELGIVSLDETLRETPPDSSATMQIFPRERFKSDGQWLAELYVYQDSTDEQPWSQFWQKYYDYDTKRRNLYQDLVSDLEQDSRGEIKAALEELKIAKPRTTQVLKPAISEDVFEALLAKVDFVAQFAVVHSAHEMISAHGETPTLVGYLVRGYANLGLLTRHHYNACSESFTARSLLYAQRLLNSDSQNDLALAHRAYAWALGGAPHHALSDLERLGSEDSANNATGKQTGQVANLLWKRLLLPYCTSDRSGLKRIATAESVLSPWAMRLWFDLTCMYKHDTWTYHAAMETVQQAPTAYGVFAEMTLTGGSLGTTRAGAYLAPTAFAEQLQASIQDVPGLPKVPSNAISENSPIEGLLHSFGVDLTPNQTFSKLPRLASEMLKKHSQEQLTSEPSWSTLALLIEEEQFVQVANFLNVSLNATERSLKAEVDAVFPLVEGHRFAGYVESFRFNERLETEHFKASLTDIEIEDPKGHMRRMLRKIWSVNKRGGKGLGQRAWINRARSFTLPGLLDYYYPTPSSWKSFNDSISSKNISAFRAVSPYSEIAVRFAANSGSEPTTKMLELWERELNEDAIAFSILAKRHMNLKQDEAAARCLEKANQILPSIATAKLLGDLYWKKDFSAWKNAYIAILGSESLGLEHHQAHSSLAYGHAYYGLWQEAKEHGIAAAESWSAWGLSVASFACEGLGLWDESEQWIRHMADAYPSTSGCQWYLWCHRTGRGNLAAAKQAAETYFSKETIKPARHYELEIGVHRILEEDARGAIEAYRKAQELKPTFTCSFMIAQLAQQLNNPKLRKRVLLDIAISEEQKREASPDDYDPDVHDAGSSILELLQSETPTDDLLQSIDEKLKQLDDTTCSAFCYFIGAELAAKGDEQQAEVYWRRALIIPHHDVLYATLAGHRLAQIHGTSRSDNDILDESDVWPPRLEEGRPETE